MTTKQKAKAYDELLIKAKQIYNKENDVLIIHTIEDLFPEVKESEDEKIRKWIINEIKIKHHNLDKENVDFVDKALAWLEKQGEQKPTWTDYDRTMAFTLLRDIDQMTYISKEGKNERLEWLNSLDDRFEKSKKT